MGTRFAGRRKGPFLFETWDRSPCIRFPPGKPSTRSQGAHFRTAWGHWGHWGHWAHCRHSWYCLVVCFIPYTQQAISIFRFHCGGTIYGPSGGLATTGITGRALLTCDQPVGRALVACDHPPADPLAGHPHPRQPFYPHPTPPRQHFNFSHHTACFNFSRHLYAILPPMEPLFRSRRRLPPFTFYHGDTLFTTPFLPFLPRGSPGGAQGEPSI
jgi:hypothetical protein